MVKKEERKAEHWVEKVAEKLDSLHPTGDMVLSAGITPSGPVHIGNLRDLITSDFVGRFLDERERGSETLFFWDDYDRLRKVPVGVPDSFGRYLGRPVSEIPCPFDCHESYARHFEEEFEEALVDLGIKPHFIYQSEEYKKGTYQGMIRTALQKRRKIAQILADFRTQAVSEQEINEYFPLNIYCHACGKDTTRVSDYDNKDMITYYCQCGKKGKINLLEENRGKLPWKVDWAARWALYGVNFEAAGKDHATKGGSFEVSARIAREVFDFQPPLFQPYEFVGISGLTSKMSGSSGLGITPKELLEVYEPSLIRWLFARSRPMKPITFNLGEQTLRLYDEFDRKVAAKGSEEQKDLSLAKVTVRDKWPEENISFRQLAAFGQVAQGNIEELKQMLARLGQSVEGIDWKARLARAETWVDKFAPSKKIEIRATPNANYYRGLTEEEQKQIQDLRVGLKDHWDLTTLTEFLYAIPGSGDKTAQREFFKNLYQLLINTDTGPRLPVFLLALGLKKVSDLIDMGR